MRNRPSLAVGSSVCLARLRIQIGELSRDLSGLDQRQVFVGNVLGPDDAAVLSTSAFLVRVSYLSHR